MEQTIIPAVEALLFISGEPLSFLRLAKTLDVSEDIIREAVEALGKRYADDSQSGLMLIINNREAVLATKKEYTGLVEAHTKSTLQDTMSKAALEVLAIIAYRAPITRSEVEAIRGVNCSFTIRNLLLRDLIVREGNPRDSRGYVYSPSFRFLESLGLSSVASLPDYESLSQDERLKMILKESSETDIPSEEYDLENTESTTPTIAASDHSKKEIES